MSSCLPSHTTCANSHFTCYNYCRISENFGLVLTSFWMEGRLCRRTEQRIVAGRPSLTCPLRDSSTLSGKECEFPLLMVAVSTMLQLINLMRTITTSHGVHVLLFSTHLRQDIFTPLICNYVHLGYFVNFLFAPKDAFTSF